MIALSGIRNGGRIVKALPADAHATAVLNEWAADSESLLDVAGLDLSGADISGADLANGLFTESVLRGVNLSGADLYRSHMEGAELSEADLSGATLVKTVLDESSLIRANLDRADLGSSEMWSVDAREASFRHAKLDGAGLLNVKLQGADLSNASVQQTSFQVVMNEQTVVLGLAGTVFGPASIVEGDELQELAGVDLEVWLNSRGAHVQVLSPQGLQGQ
ncbi:pentapeptide repeat-containing protein [Streptomyces sp. NPDC059650]|uniref:pentapeptide repeat-containing protein n=1 Tax=Streptomyces sp. NPDC059650 TaxID=3346896 RepID=UPI0036A568FE